MTNKSKGKAWGIRDLGDLWDAIDRGWNGAAVTACLSFGSPIHVTDIQIMLTDRVIEFNSDYLGA